MIKKELELIIRSTSEGDILYISEHILEEATRVFIKKFTEYIKIFDKFIKISEIKIVKKKYYESKIKRFEDIRDQYDAHVIACAETMNCEYIITGDKDILEYKQNLVKSMTSSEYLKKQKNHQPLIIKTNHQLNQAKKIPISAANRAKDGSFPIKFCRGC